MTIAIYAGSFDPVTYGHLDILKNSVDIFEKVIIAVAYNPEKKAFLPVEDRIKLIKESTKHISNVEVYSFEGLTVEFAKKHNASVLLRGLRNSADFEYENQLAQINLSLNSNIRTVFLTSKPQYSFISSSCVKELVSHKQNLSKYVPECVEKFLYKKFDY